MSLAHVRSAITLPFTFLRQSSIPQVGYRMLDVSILLLLLLRCYSLYLEIRVDCGRLRLTSSNCQTLSPHFRQMQRSWWYLLYKPRYSPFCLKFCCHGTKVDRSKIQWAPFNDPFKKTPKQMQKSLTVISYASQVIVNFVQNLVAMATGSVGGNAICSIRRRILEKPP